MDQQWTEVENYLDDLFAPHDPDLDAALRDSDAAGLSRINVSATHGKFLHVLAQGRKRVLEIGTLGGYSTIWMARALPADGRLVTLEANEQHAGIARANIERAGLDEVVEVRVGPALETLPELLGEEPFDLVFIDADKAGYPDYLPWTLELTQPGSIIVADNVVRRAAVTDSDDESVRGIKRFNEMLAAEPAVSATVLQTVGARGHDGLAIATVLGS